VPVSKRFRRKASCQLCENENEDSKRTIGWFFDFVETVTKLTVCAYVFWCQFYYCTNIFAQRWQKLLTQSTIIYSKNHWHSRKLTNWPISDQHCIINITLVPGYGNDTTTVPTHLPTIMHTYIHTYIHIYIHIYMDMYMYVLCRLRRKKPHKRRKLKIKLKDSHFTLSR
jgi:hypothetical protein